jgi:hypothetical protein
MTVAQQVLVAGVGMIRTSKIGKIGRVADVKARTLMF